MGDLISKSDVCEILADIYPTDGEQVVAVEEVDKAYEAIQQLPSAQPTLYGYNIEHLELIARVLKKEDLPPERVAEVLMDIGRIVEIVRGELEETLRKAVEQCKI